MNNLLVCIGAQKAGTSWLNYVLKHDKSFNTCPFVKEVHYFDYLYNSSSHLNNWRSHHLIKLLSRVDLKAKPIIANWLDSKKKFSPVDFRGTNCAALAHRLNLLLKDVDDDWYRELLTQGKGSWSLDITPDYSVVGSAGFNHIYQICDNVRAIYILRDPIERAWSGLLQGKKKNGGVSKFIEDIDTGKINKSKIIDQCVNGKDVGARCDYLSTLRGLASSDLKNNYKILFYDDICTKPESVVRSIYEFIDRDYNEVSDVYTPDVISQRVYATDKKSSIPDWFVEGVFDPFSKMVSELNDSNINLPLSWRKRYAIEE